MVRHLLAFAACLVLVASPALAGALAIVNAGFEADAAPVVGATGWTITSGGTDWFTSTAGAPDSTVDPDVAAEGDNWLSGNRLVTGAGSSSNPQSIEQLVDVSADATLIDAGQAVVSIDFQFSDGDPVDDAELNIHFFSDVGGTTSIGASVLSGIIAETVFAQPGIWEARNVSGAVPAGARSLKIEMINTRQSGSAGNVHFDAMRGSIDIPEPASLALVLSAVFLAFRRRS